MDILSILQRSDASEVLFGRLSSRLSEPAGHAFLEVDSHDFARQGLREVGIAEMAVLSGAAGFRGMVDAVLEEGLPGVFVFMFPEVWELTERVRERVSAMLGRSYVLLEDGWAWRVEAGKRGWRAHRGGDGESIYDRNAPQMITVWMALGDVAGDQACMHFVALDDDPNYPHDLSSTDAPLDAVRVMPIREGHALIWNANVLHWGGEHTSANTAPRYSLSITLVRSDAVRSGLPVVAQPTSLTPGQRLDMIAAQLLMYAGSEAITPELTRWATVNSALRSTR